MSVWVLTEWVPTLADLWAWGLWAEGWSGLLTWTETALDAEARPVAALAGGWVPAGVIRPSDYAQPAALATVPRLRLPPDPAAWPRLWRPAGSSTVWHGRVLAALPAPGAGPSGR